MECELTQGIFLVRPCREVSVESCAACGRRVCQSHLGSTEGKATCTDCLSKDRPKRWRSRSPSRPSGSIGEFEGGGGRSGGAGASGSWDAGSKPSTSSGTAAGTAAGVAAAASTAALAGASQSGFGAEDYAAFNAIADGDRASREVGGSFDS